MRRLKNIAISGLLLASTGFLAPIKVRYLLPPLFAPKGNRRGQEDNETDLHHPGPESIEDEMSTELGRNMAHAAQEQREAAHKFEEKIGVQNHAAAERHYSREVRTQLTLHSVTHRTIGTRPTRNDGRKI